MMREPCELQWHKSAALIAAFIWAGVGCGPRRESFTVPGDSVLRRTAEGYLHAAIKYPHNPAVRVEAVEALEATGLQQSRPWIRTALMDEHPAVRFAASVSVGLMRDSVAEDTVHARTKDSNASVRCAALFAMHRLGDHAQSGLLTGYLLDHSDLKVRRNAALLLGFLGEHSAIRVLARSMKDADAGVRQHSLEALARLGNDEARKELIFMTSSGVGMEEVFAIHALANLAELSLADTFRYKLSTATHLETRLAAARALGQLGFDDGYDLAIRSLVLSQPIRNDPKDPPVEQLLRLRQLAADALGAMKRREALGALSHMLGKDPDPRMQVSAARAILQILNQSSSGDLPFDRIEPRSKG